MKIILVTAGVVVGGVATAGGIAYAAYKLIIGRHRGVL